MFRTHFGVPECDNIYVFCVVLQQEGGNANEETFLQLAFSLSSIDLLLLLLRIPVLILQPSAFFFFSCTFVFLIQMFSPNSSILLFCLHSLTPQSSFSPTTSSSVVLLLPLHIIGSFPSFHLLFLHTFTYSPHTILSLSAISYFFLLHRVILPSQFHFFIFLHTFYFFFDLHSAVLLHTLTSSFLQRRHLCLSFLRLRLSYNPIFIPKISQKICRRL